MLFPKVVIDTSDASDVLFKKGRILFRSDEAFVTWDKSLSVFLPLGNQITFWKHAKDCHTKIKMFWPEQILPVLNLSCHLSYHFYIFQEAQFHISSCSCWVGDHWNLNWKQDSHWFPSVGTGLIAACIHGVSHSSITLRWSHFLYASLFNLFNY